MKIEQLRLDTIKDMIGVIQQTETPAELCPLCQHEFTCGEAAIIRVAPTEEKLIKLADNVAPSSTVTAMHLSCFSDRLTLEGKKRWST